MKAPTRWTRLPKLAAAGWVLVVTIVSLVVFHNLSTPSYEGRSIGEWLAWFDSPAGLSQEEWQERWQKMAEATHALRQMGADAFIEFRRMLRPDSGAKKFLYESTREFRKEHVPVGSAVPPSPEEARMLRVVEACSALGRDAQPMISDLLLVLRSNPYWNVRSRAAYALGEIGGAPEEVVPALLQSLRDRTDGNVLISLGKYGAEADGAVPSIVALLEGLEASVQKHESIDRNVMYEAAQALHKIAPREAEKRLPFLREVLQEERAPYWQSRLGKVVNVISGSSANQNEE